ncbi:MAG TPA: PaaI family thioesterase [Acidimicrobiales bacterium]|nr:PaaI family thioesterase [Acidimicrobiales bacterium]
MDGGCYACGDDNPVGLGLTFEARPPGVVATFKPRAEHRGAPGLLHGGVAATCLDETMAALGFLLDGVHTVTATLELRYRHPVPLDGGAVTIEAWRDRTESRRRQRVHGRLLLADGRAAVEARGIFVQVPRRTGGG